MSDFYQELKKNGYMILKKQIAVPSFSRLQKDIDILDNQMIAIFKRSKHLKRFQSYITPKQQELTNLIKLTIQSVSKKLPMHSFENAVLLKSSKGCEVQPAHSDYQPECDDSDNYLQACGLLLAIMPNTTLTLWENLKNNNLTMDHGSVVLPTTIHLDIGDILLFTGDQIHSGSAYDEINYRIHIYVDSPFQKMAFENKTWRVDQNGPKQPNRCIELLKNVENNDFKNYIQVIYNKQTNKFFELDSLTRKEILNITDGIIYYATPNLDPLQGNKDPYDAPNKHTRRSEFAGYTKCLWYKCRKTHIFKYFAFDKQSAEIQQNPFNLQKGTTLFWVLELNPETNKPWPESIQISVIHDHIL